MDIVTLTENIRDQLKFCLDSTEYQELVELIEKSRNLISEQYPPDFFLTEDNITQVAVDRACNISTKMGRLRLRLLVARRDFRDLSSDVLDELKNNNILKASGTIKDEIDSFSNKIIDANDIALGVYSKLGQSLRDTRTVLGLRKQLL